MLSYQADAMMLNEQGLRLSRQGKHEEALEAFLGAVKVYRQNMDDQDQEQQDQQRQDSFSVDDLMYSRLQCAQVLVPGQHQEDQDFRAVLVEPLSAAPTTTGGESASSATVAPLIFLLNTAFTKHVLAWKQTTPGRKQVELLRKAAKLYQLAIHLLTNLQHGEESQDASTSRTQLTEIVIYCNLGHVYELLGDQVTALMHYQRMISLIVLINNSIQASCACSASSQASRQVFDRFLQGAVHFLYGQQIAAAAA